MDKSTKSKGKSAKAVKPRKRTPRSAPRDAGVMLTVPAAKAAPTIASTGEPASPGPKDGSTADPTDHPMSEGPTAPAPQSNLGARNAEDSAAVEAAAARVPAPSTESSSASEAVQQRRPFGERVKGLMQDRGLTQTDLARKTGMDRSELNRLLNDKRDPGLVEIAWIASALGVEPETLVDWENPSDSLRRALQQMESAAKRVLRAEGERDEVREEIGALKQVLAGERATRARERRETAERDERERAKLMERVSHLEGNLRESHAALAREQERHAAVVKQLHDEAQGRIWALQSAAHQAEAGLRVQVNELQQALDSSRLQLVLSNARNQSQAQQIQKLQDSASKLQQSLASEGDTLAATTVFTGLAGLLFGAALAGNGSKRRR